MSMPVFKRRSMSFNMANYYARNTDVWVFGSPSQYRSFADLLCSDRDEAFRIPAAFAGMDLLVLPPTSSATRDFVVLHERVVYQEGRFNMELIAGGSGRGFRLLPEEFLTSARKHQGDTDRHIHFDADQPLLVLPSVFLNIRGPLDDIEMRLEELAPPDREDLPSGAGDGDPSLWPYDPINGYGDLFGRLPLD